MVQKVIHLVASKGVQINLSTEEYVRDMELRSNDAA